MDRQYSTLAKLAVDAHPEVRRVAVQGVCRVLATYWEMIPLEKITLLLDSLLLRAGETVKLVCTDDNNSFLLAKDKSTPQIRAAVLEGLLWVMCTDLLVCFHFMCFSLVLENPMSHTALVGGELY